MPKLTQNNKIIVSAIAIFLVSFALMLFFLENNGADLDHGRVDVLHSGEHREDASLETFYRNYLKDVDALMFVANVEGEVNFADSEFCGFLAVGCEEFVGSVFFDYINSKDLSAFTADHSKLIQEGEAIEGLGPYRMLKGNEEILVLLNAYPILDKDDRVTEIVFSVKDLTEQVEEMQDKSEGGKKKWIQEVYPRIKEMRDQPDVRMMVDKISYKAPE